MVSWSCLGRGRSFGINILKGFGKPLQNASFSTGKALQSDHKTMAIQPSRWQWHKFKDMFHFYLFLGIIPAGLVIFYTNVFIGPATLAVIPEDYTPKHWEYHRHPITRFLARYVYNNPQQDYEKFLHFLDEEAQRIKIRELEKQILHKMAERNDYQAYYYRPMVNKYLRINKQTGEEMYNRLGDDYKD